MSDAFASVSCSIEIYPFEAGPYYLSGGQIRSVSISKSLRGNAAGTFSIELAPGGPLGPEDPDTWSQIVTPISHVVIGMARGQAQNIVLDGIATEIGEAQQWATTNQGSQAARGQGISGGDFSWFFNSFNFYALTFYGLVAGSALGGALDYLPGSLANLISKGLIGGTGTGNSPPVQVGRTWYQLVMGGRNGILGNTYVPYKPIGTRVPFYQAVAATWENYPDVFIPYADNFMSEDTWSEKFRSIFGSPWYEFFVTTAPAGAYPLPGGSTGFQDSGTTFGMQSMPSAVPAGPQLVARVNPWPRFNAAAGSSGGIPVPGPVDASRWNALPLFDFTSAPFGFLKSSVGFSAGDAYNFYQLNPTSYGGMFGVNPVNNVPAIFSFICASDPASVQRYGFRPRIGSTRWMFDPTGAAAQQGLNIQDTILQLTANLVSWEHPGPLMAQGSVTVPLNPAILIGTRFRYAPFKDGEPWDFYVEGFRHDFTFGGPSTTTLTLTRGLPAAIYADASDGGLLKAIMTGNASRVDGTYTVGLPQGSASALQFVETQAQAAAINQQLANVFVTPQPGV
jgi:hypothetical protein